MTQKTNEEPIVERKVGKKYLKMHESHKLPFYYTEFSFYDRALPRICKKISDIDGYLMVVDVGANIGDTVSLITDKVQGTFLCIDGDDKYLSLLKENLKDLKNSQVFIEGSFCAASDDIKERNFKIERIDGTAKIVTAGDEGDLPKKRFKTLDSIIEQYPSFKKANVVKIDTDGFEINVLKGGEKFLKKSTPILFFEFTPELYVEKGQNPMFVFEFLQKHGYKVALLYDNFGRPIEIIDTLDSDKVKKLLALIDNRNIYYYDILTYHESKKEKYGLIFESELLASFSLAKNKLDETKSQLDSTKSELDSTRSQLDSTKSELDSTRSQLDSAKAELERVYSSREWRAVSKLQKLVKFLIPSGSLRRKTAISLWRLIRKIKNKIFFRETKNVDELYQPKKSRKINLNSKKIVFIGHSFHEKTKSSLFFLDYLKQFYEVEIIWDESWKGEPFTDLSFIDRDYLGVIFWQVIPPSDTLQKVKNENLIFVPMYDGVPLDWEFWKHYQNLKIISFSKTLQESLKKWNFDSVYFQYFPEVGEFFPGKANEVFFWQRHTNLNINLIAKLFEGDDLKIHIHKAVDPNQEFVQPSREIEERYKITYSDWFDTREEMLALVRQKGIYVAPRALEGIGLSFLEAMAMGKAVVAVDNPTMNEYIENNKTGYLFNLENPAKIDLSNIDEVQRNAYAFMREGRKKWEEDKQKIIDFIKKG